MTDGQSASLSWNKAPIWGLRPDFHCCQTVMGLLMWGALSDERSGLFIFTTVLVSPVQSFSGPSPVGLTTIFYCLRIEASLSVASYDSQGYSESIRPRLHTGVLPANQLLVLSVPGEVRRQKTMSHISSVIQRKCCHANNVYLAVT
jgi:hypothetical protein